MNIIDERRELGILRALGLTKGQVCKLVLMQAAILAGVTIVPGSIAGAGLAYLISTSQGLASPAAAGFHIEAVMIVCPCVMSVGVALLAALVPARRIANTSIIGAI
jgi:ABC-type antimicrobial peptide transport system permease subunit